MPRIKTTTYTIKGEDFKVNFNCSSKGVFSVNIPTDIRDLLNLDARLTATSLEELENTVSDAINSYKNAETKHSLHILVIFGVSGEFMYNEEKVMHPEMHTSYHLRASFGTIDNLIGLDYKVLIKKVIDGREYFYYARHRDQIPYTIHDHHVVHNDYVGEDRKHHFRDNEKVIDYSVDALQNLMAITEQFRKAAIFMLKLVNSDDLQYQLETSDLKLIE